MSAIPEINIALSQHLNKIAKEYRAVGDNPHRIKAFTKAALNISQTLSPVISGAYARANIEGVGESIEKVIDDFLASGSSQRLKQMHEDDKEDELKVLELFQSYYGIGPSTAKKFYDEGYRTIQDLMDHANLSEAQTIGIIWHDHIQQRIPRGEIDLIRERIGYLLDPYGIKWIIAGSYRRQEPLSGDVDILVEEREDLNMQGLVLLLSSILPAKLALGDTKFMGIVRLSKNYYGHRIDIRMVSAQAFPFALMYFTGSQQFNILMRQRALDLGYTLNEYALISKSTNEEGEVEEVHYMVDDESDIFDLLGLLYVPPQERFRTLRHLEVIDQL